MDYLLALTHERYSVLAAWPDFTAAYGKDYYYRAHPADLQKFYGLVDEFHRMFDIVTEFDSLSGLASQLVPSERAAPRGWEGPGRLWRRAGRGWLLQHHTHRMMPQEGPMPPVIIHPTEVHASDVPALVPPPSPRPRNTLTSTQLLCAAFAGYRVRRQNTIHPAVGPAVADGAAIQFLLAHAK